MKHILILGAGFGGLQTYLSLRQRLGDRSPIHITLLNRYNYFLYMPMLHEAAFGAVNPRHITHAVREFLKNPKDQFLEDEVVQIIPAQNMVLTKKGKKLCYDFLVIALGSRQAYFDIPGAERHAYPLKSLLDGILLRNRVIEIFERYEEGELFFTVVGGGATGVETAGQMAELFRGTLKKLYPHVDFSKVHITLVHNTSRLLPHLRGKIGIRVLKKLSEMNVRVMLERRVEEVKEGSVIFSDGESISSHVTVWTVGLASPAPSFILPEHLNERGFLQIDESLILPETENVFAIGDIAECSTRPTPKTAQAAVQAGKHTAKNLLRLLRKKKPLPFRYHHRGDLIPISNWFGVAQIGRFSFSGKFAWWLRRTIFLFNLYKPLDRVKIVFDWTMNIFSPRDTSKIE